MSRTSFLEEFGERYSFKGESIILGVPKYGEETLTENFVRLPLKTMNRHGLIAGATGTGKTKTLQILAEQLSAKGVCSLVMDIKGDLSGVAAPAEHHPKITERHEKIGLPFIPDSSPVEFLSLSEELGLPLRATVTEFSPVLFSKMLGLNDIQQGIVTVLYKYCDDRDIPLLDLKDFRMLIQYVQGEGKEDIQGEYGRISSASLGAIMRRIVELEQQGASQFFGERSFDVEDLLHKDAEGRGVISILRLTDIQDKPKLFSTFLLQMLAEVYSVFPEAGDTDKPKLVMFIDEAHLMFDQASDALMDQIETIIKLIRSKGVGIYFVTQDPNDVPDEILGQLGMKLQHALRAFTAKDRKAIKLAVQNYPITDHYDPEQLITELGIGEALFTCLDEKGVPTPLVHLYLRAPQSRMDVLTPGEISNILSYSTLLPKYNTAIDRESAYEYLTGKMDEARTDENRNRRRDERSRESKTRRGKEDRFLDRYVDKTVQRQIGRTVAKEVTRGLLGVLGVSASKRRSRRKRWF